MRETDPDTLMFFDAHPEALSLYLAFEDLLHAPYQGFAEAGAQGAEEDRGRGQAVEGLSHLHSVALAAALAK